MIRTYEDIPEIYYITVVDNIESFLNYGILSRNEILKRKIPYKDCSNATVQSARSKINIGGLNLHDYANLYFGKRPPMHYNMVFRQGIPQQTICYICVKNDILLIPGMYFTDGHIIYSYTSVYNDIKDLDKLSWNILNDPNFLAKNSDGSYKYGNEGKIKRKKQAEVLIPHIIPPKYFKRIIVYSEDIKMRVREKIGNSINIDVDRSFYF